MRERGRKREAKINILKRTCSTIYKNCTYSIRMLSSTEKGYQKEAFIY